MFRFLSVISRKIKSRKSEVRILKQFFNWKKQLENENLRPRTPALKILIIRLDDIGDYILFRNFLASYKIAKRWKHYTVTLLGNIVWKDLFEMYDANTVDSIIWVDKKQYFNDASYRSEIWMNLHAENFETIICPSRTRQLLLDDICALATKAPCKIAAINTTYHSSWNKTSDAVYTELFCNDEALAHEFYFNKAFTQWCCSLDLSAINLSMPHSPKKAGNYIICFIGASTKSKKWPEQNWVELIKLLQQHYQFKILIAGGKDDESAASGIALNTNTESIAGKTSLAEITDLIANAIVIISNDTMATHIAAAWNTPTVLLANGNNFYRFTNYAGINMEHVQPLYPEYFSDVLKRKGNHALKKYIAVTADIASIKPVTVLTAINKFLNK